MLTLSHTGIPGVTCGKCGDPIPLDQALALKQKSLTSVQFACLECSEKLKEQFPDLDFVLARVYFEALLATGRPKRVLQVRS